MGMRWFYELWYRYGTPPWVMGPREELVRFVQSGRLRPGRAIDLGCGVGDNAIFLAQHGFDVVGVDFSPAAIEQARERARAAGVDVRFEVADVFALPDLGEFDLVVDYGTSDDFRVPDRQRFKAVVGRLLAAGGEYLLWCFEWELALWERVLVTVLPFGHMAKKWSDMNA